jgi:hypothetical protein
MGMKRPHPEKPRRGERTPALTPLREDKPAAVKDREENQSRHDQPWRYLSRSVSRYRGRGHEAVSVHRAPGDRADQTAIGSVRADLITNTKSLSV